MRNASPAVTVLSSIPCLLLVTGEDVEAAVARVREEVGTFGNLEIVGLLINLISETT